MSLIKISINDTSSIRTIKNLKIMTMIKSLRRLPVISALIVFLGGCYAEANKQQGDPAIPMAYKVGDEVLYGKYAGTEITIDGKEYLIMRESDIYATL